MPSLFTNLDVSIDELSISETGLIAICFPRLRSLTNLVITDNQNLTLVELPKVSMGSGSSRNPDGIKISGNHLNLSLSLPSLGGVAGMFFLSGLRKVELPRLAIVGDWTSDPTRRREGSLVIGAQDEWLARCVNCLPTYLTSFSAPKLTMVMGRIQFDSSPHLRHNSFPVLNYAGEFMTNNTLATELENGLSIPRLRRVGHVQVVRTKVSSCEFWKNLYCTGGVSGSYFCARNDLWIPHHYHHHNPFWPYNNTKGDSFPPNCTGDEYLPPPAPTSKQDPWRDEIDRFESQITNSTLLPLLDLLVFFTAAMCIFCFSIWSIWKDLRKRRRSNAEVTEGRKRAQASLTE